MTKTSMLDKTSMLASMSKKIYHMKTTLTFCQKYLRFSLPVFASNCDAPVCRASEQHKQRQTINHLTPDRLSTTSSQAPYIN